MKTLTPYIAGQTLVIHVVNDMNNPTAYLERGFRRSRDMEACQQHMLHILESILLEHAAAGIDVASDEYTMAIENVVFSTLVPV